MVLHEVAWGCLLIGLPGLKNRQGSHECCLGRGLRANQQLNVILGVGGGGGREAGTGVGVGRESEGGTRGCMLVLASVLLMHHLCCSWAIVTWISHRQSPSNLI